MVKKITWNMIYKEFKKHFPNMGKNVTYWRPHDYATIEIFLKDGSKVLYNFDLNKVEFLKERWIKDREVQEDENV